MTRLFAGTPFDIPPTCDDCGRLESECVCTAAQKAEADAARARVANRLDPASQTARVQLEKRKGARMVTIVSGLTSKANDLPAVLARLQAACGTGGTVKAKDDILELQGDHVKTTRQVLVTLGFKVR